MMREWSRNYTTIIDYIMILSSPHRLPSLYAAASCLTALCIYKPNIRFIEASILSSTVSWSILLSLWCKDLIH